MQWLVNLFALHTVQAGMHNMKPKVLLYVNQRYCYMCYTLTNLLYIIGIKFTFLQYSDQRSVECMVEHILHSGGGKEAGGEEEEGK